MKTMQQRTSENAQLIKDITYIFTEMGTAEQLAFIFCWEAVQAGEYKKAQDADFLIKARAVPEADRKALIAYFWQCVKEGAYDRKAKAGA